MTQVSDLDDALVVAGLNDTAEDYETLEATALMHNNLLAKEKFYVLLKMHVHNVPRAVRNRSIVSRTTSSEMFNGTTKELTSVGSRSVASNRNKKTKRTSYKQMRQTIE